MHVIFAVLVAMMVVAENPLVRALWAVPLILVFQVGWLMAKLRSAKTSEKNVEIPKTEKVRARGGSNP